MINKNIGDKYKHLLCDKCKKKVVEETSKLRKVDMLFARRILKKFKNILCDDCFNKVLRGIKQNAK